MLLKIKKILKIKRKNSRAKVRDKGTNSARLLHIAGKSKQVDYFINDRGCVAIVIGHWGDLTNSDINNQLLLLLNTFIERKLA
jgi:hypothetical protein